MIKYITKSLCFFIILIVSFNNLVTGSIGDEIEIKHRLIKKPEKEKWGLVEFSYRLPKNINLIGDLATFSLFVPDGVLIKDNPAWSEKLLPNKWYKKNISIKVLGPILKPLILEILGNDLTEQYKGRIEVDLSRWSLEKTDKDEVKASTNYTKLDLGIDDQNALPSITTVEQINLEPLLYSGKAVTVQVKYGMGDFRNRMANIKYTRSDGAVSDNTGAIWMIGGLSLKKSKDTDELSIVNCRVFISENGQPYLVPGL